MVRTSSVRHSPPLILCLRVALTVNFGLKKTVARLAPTPRHASTTRAIDDLLTFISPPSFYFVFSISSRSDPKIQAMSSRLSCRPYSNSFYSTAKTIFAASKSFFPISTEILLTPSILPGSSSPSIWMVFPTTMSDISISIEAN